MKIGLIDADLLDGGTRFPNLTIMKLAGYFKEIRKPYELISDSEDVNLDDYERIFVSKVFTKTELPKFCDTSSKFKYGGTGFYATSSDADFEYLREKDMRYLTEKCDLEGYDPATQFPDYSVYDSYINKEIGRGIKASNFKGYKDFSIGFLTRGCVRHCPFCVNRYSIGVRRYSYLDDFYDSRRPYIYLWDDNILASPQFLFDECMSELIDENVPFQFRQGLDLRLMTDYKAKLLNRCRYYGDFIFAFDNWGDREIIKNKLKLWRSICNKPTKLYLFCGYRIKDDNALFDDVLHIFKRIKILMSYGCLGYIMRHDDYNYTSMPNIYVQIARWCNQPQFYKKMSFLEYIENSQKYVKNKVAKPIETMGEFKRKFATRMNEIMPYLNIKFTDFNN